MKKICALLLTILLLLCCCTVTYYENVSAHRAVVSMNAGNPETLATEIPGEEAAPSSAFTEHGEQSGETEYAPADEGETAETGTVGTETEAVGNSESVAAETDIDETVERADTVEEFVVVPRFYNFNVGQALEYLASYGISAKPDDEQAGQNAPVVVVSFFGRLDDENFYFMPGMDVTLKVGGVPEEHEQRRDYTPISGKVAYLTFDDGPTKNNTQRILDILDSYGIKATFFVVGSSMERFPGRVKAICESENVIGCHSYSHDFTALYTSKDGFLSDLQRWYDAAYGELGEDYVCTLYRMPGGSACAEKYAGYGEVAAELAMREYRVFDWTMSNNDVWSRSKSGGLTPVEYMKKCFSEQINAIDGTRKPVIILMHETYDATVEMLPWAIELLLSMGYSFDTLDNYAGEYFQ